MKFHIPSDLHLEKGDYTPAVPAADLVILAGDIHKGALAVRWACREYPQLPVLLVPGNHKYYSSTIQAVQKELREAARGTKVVILDNNPVTIDGVRFLGTTLWTDFRFFGADPARYNCGWTATPTTTMTMPWAQPGSSPTSGAIHTRPSPALIQNW